MNNAIEERQYGFAAATLISTTPNGATLLRMPEVEAD